MTALTVVSTEVYPVEGDEVQTLPAGVDITAGQAIKEDANGVWQLSNATDAANLGDPWLAGFTVKANMPLTAYKAGSLIDMGSAIDALAPGAAVYVNDAAGSLGDAAGTVSHIMGRVTSGHASIPPQKLLRLVSL